MKAKADVPFAPLNIAVLTVSDTRTLETDTPQARSSSTA